MNTNVTTTKRVPNANACARYGVRIGNEPSAVSKDARSTAIETTASSAFSESTSRSTNNPTTVAIAVLRVARVGGGEGARTAMPVASVKRTARMIAVPTSSRWATSHAVSTATTPPVHASRRFDGRRRAASAATPTANTSATKPNPSAMCRFSWTASRNPSGAAVTAARIAGRRGEPVRGRGREPGDIVLIMAPTGGGPGSRPDLTLRTRTVLIMRWSPAVSSRRSSCCWSRLRPRAARAPGRRPALRVS